MFVLDLLKYIFERYKLLPSKRAIATSVTVSSSNNIRSWETAAAVSLSLST